MYIDPTKISRYTCVHLLNSYDSLDISGSCLTRPVICQTFWGKLVGLQWDLVQRQQYGLTTGEMPANFPGTANMYINEVDISIYSLKTHQIDTQTLANTSLHGGCMWKLLYTCSDRKRRYVRIRCECVWAARRRLAG